MTSPYAHRPFFYKATNALGSIGHRIGIEPRLSSKYLLEKARRTTGLDDFGETDFITDLEILTQSLEEEARLNTIGKLSAATYLHRLLCNRLNIENNRKNFPEVAEQKISRPIFITGLPRSGTTFLHALLAEDPNTRSPKTWEVMYPSPPPLAKAKYKDKRFAKCASDLKWFDRLAPRFSSIHALKPNLPQECIAITTNAFASIQFHTTYNVPAYQAWLEQRDMVPAYKYHNSFLQHLQLHNKNERWLLKAPAHLYDIDALMQVYPDAQIIQTHRDPLQVIGSISSHTNVVRAAFSDVLDPHSIAKDWRRYWQLAVTRMQNYRDQHPSLAICDIYYSDLIADPVRVVKTLYKQLDLEFSAEFEIALQRYIGKNPQNKHKYTLQDFGLDGESTRAMFSDYYRCHQSLSNVESLKQRSIDVHNQRKKDVALEKYTEIDSVKRTDSSVVGAE